MNVGGVPSFILKPRPDFEKKLDFTENYGGMRVAIDTVRAKTVLTEVFADKFASQGIDVNVFHPGTVKSDMGRNMSFPMSVVFKVANLSMSKTSKTEPGTSVPRSATTIRGGRNSRLGLTTERRGADLSLPA